MTIGLDRAHDRYSIQRSSTVFRISLRSVLSLRVYFVFRKKMTGIIAQSSVHQANAPLDYFLGQSRKARAGCAILIFSVW